MSFTKYSQTGSPLTFARENQNFARLFEDGPIEGMQAYPDSATVDYSISIFGGYGVVDGVLIYDDEDNQEILDLGASTNDAHWIIWLDNSGDEPEYKATKDSGGPDWSYTSPGELTAGQLANGFKIADVWIPSTASSIQDAIIQNVPSTSQDASPSLEFVSESVTITDVAGPKYKIEFTGAKIIAFSPNKSVADEPLRFPLMEFDVEATASGGSYDFELTSSSNVSAGDFVFFYVREPNAWTDNSSALELFSTTFNGSGAVDGDTELGELVGLAEDPVTELFPNRPGLDNIFIVAIVDTDNDAVYFPKASMSVGDVYENGLIDAYTQAVYSTEYGTGFQTPDANGRIDLDDVFNNTDKLKNATLDTAYDGFAAGSSAGDGRTINVDAGPIFTARANLENQYSSDVDSPWQNTIEFEQQIYDSGSQLRSESSIDAYAILGGAGTPDSVSAIRLRRGYETTVDLSASVGRVLINFTGGYPAPAAVTTGQEEKRFITFPTGGTEVTGNATNNVYRLKIDSSTGGYYLETLDGVDNIIGTYPAEFTALPEASIDVILWVMEADVNRGQSVFNDLDLSGDIYGPGGQVHFIASNMAHRSTFDDVKDLCRNAEYTWQADLSFAPMTALTGSFTRGGNDDSIAVLPAMTGANMTESFSDGARVIRSSNNGANSYVEIYEDATSVWSKTVTGATSASVAIRHRYAALGYDDDDVEIWDWVDDTLIDTLSVGAGSFNINSLEINNNFIIVGCDNTAGSVNVVIWDIESGGSDLDAFEAGDAGDNCIFVHAADGFLVAATNDGGDYVVSAYELNSDGSATLLRKLGDRVAADTLTWGDLNSDIDTVAQAFCVYPHIVIAGQTSNPNAIIETYPLFQSGGLVTPLQNTAPLGALTFDQDADNVFDAITVDDKYVYVASTDGSADQFIECYSVPDLSLVWSIQSDPSVSVDQIVDMGDRIICFDHSNQKSFEVTKEGRASMWTYNPSGYSRLLAQKIS